ncbi:chemotaxis protein [Alkalihalobacillus sp. LMS39]|uniref:chemotaxis protein n=1 Tax=Alkalihalobacillus sp. LMS39 TaxID=2924032 RepID=UPI001FB46198|nr:chemotaxis protein [Alkalihalobacillus sp. LMS39]UOE92619.1 chemotaxis protein [Alkalihalobacillus sp. LMS39]
MFEGNNSKILLESGTNELEIIMFNVGNSTFGINVLKVREIIQPLPITETPNGHPFVEGVIRLRDEVIPVVDLAKVLHFPPSADGSTDKFIIAELNKLKVAFHVHNVSRIHRISWEQIEKPSHLSKGEQAQTIGIVKLEGEMSLLLDFEKIVVDINPEAGLQTSQLSVLGPRERSTKKIIVAEDSAILRKLLQDTLQAAGYENVQFFENGKLAWEHLSEVAKEETDITEHVHLIISDIEMPQMDGHHFTKLIKQHPKLVDVPVIIFSSIISSDLQHKGESVGAIAQVSKPEIVELVNYIDKYIL